MCYHIMCMSDETTPSCHQTPSNNLPMPSNSVRNSESYSDSDLSEHETSSLVSSTPVLSDESFKPKKKKKKITGYVLIRSFALL